MRVRIKLKKPDDHDYYYPLIVDQNKRYTLLIFKDGTEKRFPNYNVEKMEVVA